MGLKETVGIEVQLVDAAVRGGAGKVDDPRPLTVISPRNGWVHLNLGEVVRYRELLWQLAYRDIAVRYKQTIIGAAWAVLQPFVTMVIFTLLFQALNARPTVSSAPPAVSMYVALLPWQLFAGVLSRSGESLVANPHLITKVYFPRLVIVLAPVLSALFDFAIAFVILIGLMVWFGVIPSIAVLALPLFLVFAVAASFATGIWFAALSAHYRDFRYALPFVIQTGMFITPVVYETGSLNLPRWLEAFYSLNPMVGVVEGFRWALLGSSEPPLMSMAISMGMVAVILFTGLAFFQRLERTFADVV